MKILFVCAVFPYPLHSGGQIRVYNLLKRLSNEHEITLCSFIRKEEEKKYIHNLSFCRSVYVVLRGHAWRPSYIVKSLLGKYPLVMSTYDNNQMRMLVARNLYGKDCIHVEPGYVWPAIPKTTLPIVVCEHNIEHTVYQEYADSHRYPFVYTVMKNDVEKLRRWEMIIWKKAAHLIAVSEEDASEMRKVRSDNISIVPNGIDEKMFLYRPKKTVPKQFTCLFVGNFRWIQNIDAAQFLLKDLWPQIHDVFPNAVLRIVGRDFPKKFLPVSSSIIIVPYVEDIRNELSACDIVLAPIRIGGGTKYKILEAMAMGRGVITTTKGVQGLPLIHKRHCLIADEIPQWIESIRYMVENPSECKKIVNNARMLVEKEYSWDKIANTLSAVWKRLPYQSL
jgi:glycosyltransferase involved in cell wall biosynthesis